MRQCVIQRLLVGIGDDQQLLAVRILHGHGHDGRSALADLLEFSEINGKLDAFLQIIQRRRWLVAHEILLLNCELSTF